MHPPPVGIAFDAVAEERRPEGGEEAGVARVNANLESDLSSEWRHRGIVGGAGHTWKYARHRPAAGSGLPHHRAGSTVVLKGSTMLAIGMVHHADSGPDDPNVDGPLLKSLAAQAIQHV